MRPAEFSSETIIKAGEELLASNRNITGFALRQKVGGGNPARLKQVWDEHINSQAVTSVEPAAELPVEVAEQVATVAKALTERLATLAVELNDKAVKAADRRVHDVVRSAGEQREQAERELADAAQTVEDLEAQLEDAGTTAAELRSQLAEALASNQTQAVELATVRERLSLIEHSSKAAIEQHAADLARVTANLETVTADRDQARAQVQEAQGQARELVRRAQEQEAALEAQRGQLATSELAGARLTGQLDQARQEATDADRRALAAETQAERTAEALEAAQAATTTAERAADALRLEVATLTERAAHIEDLRAIIERLQAPAHVPQDTETTASPLRAGEVPVVPSAAKKKTVAKRAARDPKGGGS